MNCHNHPDHPVARECRVCHHLICTECIVEVGQDVLCKSCVAEHLLHLQSRLQKVPTRSTQKTPSSESEVSTQETAIHTLRDKDEALKRPFKNGFLTVLFSCLPGLGHYYLGLEKRGLNLMVLFFGLIFLYTIIPREVTFPVGLGFPVLWFYSQFDALKYRALINEGAFYEDTPVIPKMASYVTYKHLGWLLAILAMVAIVSNLMSFVPFDRSMQQTIKELLSALVLLGVGFWILKGKNVPFVTREKSE